MRVLEVSYGHPEQNLALDEVLLTFVESGTGTDVLRLWECPVPCVVIGSGQEIKAVAHVQECLQAGIPVLRRCTAGGAVVQGPGSLNYSLCLSLDRFPEVREIKTSYQYLLGKLIEVFSSHGLEMTLEGVCDIALDGRKVSGNAQRRKRNGLLHHGTILYQDLAPLMERCLVEPKEQPEYRGNRTHSSFVGQIPWPKDKVIDAVREAFAPDCSANSVTEEENNAVLRLAKEKYASDLWIHRR